MKIALVEITERLLASWKYIHSFFVRRWEFKDYPVRVEYFPDVVKRWGSLRAELHVNVLERQLRDPPWAGTWFAHVINWPELSRFGDSPEEALAGLRTEFAEWKTAGEPFPRPGTSVSTRAAAGHRIAEHPELAADFFRRILATDYRNHWISDETVLADLHAGASNHRLVEKILLTYGVDVSDIADGPLVEILKRIVAQGAWGGWRILNDPDQN